MNQRTIELIVEFAAAQPDKRFVFSGPDGQRVAVLAPEGRDPMWQVNDRVVSSSAAHQFACAVYTTNGKALIHRSAFSSTDDPL